MRAHRALGPAGGARRVEDGGVVLRVDGDVGRRGGLVHGAQRQGERPLGDRCGTARRLPDLEGSRRLGPVLVGHDERAEVGQAAQEGPEALGPLGVDEGHLGAGVLEAVAQLLAAPPRIERHHDGAGERGRPEGHDPLGQVAHDDGDAVALGDAERRLQAVRQRAGDAVVLREGGPLVLVDQEDGVAVAERHVEDGPERGRRVLPGPGGHAADVELLHLEELAGRRQRGVGLRHGHGRGVLAGAHSAPFSVVPEWSKIAAR